MNLRLVACLLALALAAWLVFSLAGGRERASRSRDEAAVPTSASEPMSALEAELAAPDVAPSTTAPAASQIERSAVESVAPGSWRGELAGLTGRVVESDGAPVPGIRVALLQFEGSLLFDGAALEEREPSLELEETTTDAAG